MTLRVRRVVTGHDSQGKAIVVSDALVPVTTRRPGQQGSVVWALERIPADNLDPADGALSAQATLLRNGVVLRILRYDAGAAGNMHRTESLDCGVIISGSIVLELDDGVEVELHAGDTVVQRGTIHKWTNRGSEPCTIAFVLVDAMPIGDAN